MGFRGGQNDNCRDTDTLYYVTESEKYIRFVRFTFDSGIVPGIYKNAYSGIEDYFLILRMVFDTTRSEIELKRICRQSSLFCQLCNVFCHINSNW